MIEPLFRNKSAAGHFDRPLVIAHRGASGLAPENTLAAFRLAVAMGADGIELDVQLSADHRAVVIHDRRVNRTTNATGAVSNFTAEELNRLDAGRWFERRLAGRPRARAAIEQANALAEGREIKYAGEPVPTLEAVLSLLAQSGLGRVYIELKDRPGNKEALLDEALAHVREFRLQRSVTLLSFDHRVIRQAKKISPEIRAAATFPFSGGKLMTSRAIARAVKETGADEAAIHFGLVSRRTVDALHESGLSVSVWTANNRLIMRRLVSCGVDSIMTNYPNRLIDLLNSQTTGGKKRKGIK